MEPDESCTILCGEVGEHLIEGISDGFVPGIFSRHGKLVNDALTVESKEAIEEMRRMGPENTDYSLARVAAQTSSPPVRSRKRIPN